MAKSTVHSEEAVLSLMWRRSLFQDGCRQARTLPPFRSILGIEGDILLSCTVAFQESIRGHGGDDAELCPCISVMALSCDVVESSLEGRKPATSHHMCDFHLG